MGWYTYERREDGSYLARNHAGAKVGIVRRSAKPERKEYPWEIQCPVCSRVRHGHRSRDRAVFDLSTNCAHEGE